MKRLSYLPIVALFIMLYCSCEQNNGDLGSKLDNVVTNAATDVTPFSVTLNGTINNFSVADISRGEYGFLYVVSKEIDELQAESVFKEFANNGYSSECKKKVAIALLENNNFNIELSGLNPMDNIYYCAMFITKDNKILIGKTEKVSLIEFSPKLKSAVIDSVTLMNSTITITADFCNATSKECSTGIIYSLNEEDLLTTGVKAEYSDKIENLENGTYTMNLSLLKAGKTYYYKPYIYYKTRQEYYYGDLSSFTTLDPSTVAVDLGLSVMWASCDLGSMVPTEPGLKFAWGEIVPKKTYTQENYRFTLDEFKQLSDDISGSEYDAATYYWGGKWRMPTYAEWMELFELTVTETTDGVPIPLKENWFYSICRYRKDNVYISMCKGTYYRKGTYGASGESYGHSASTKDYSTGYDFSVYGGFKQGYHLAYDGALIRPVCDY